MPLALVDVLDQLSACRALAALHLGRTAAWVSAHTGLPGALAAAAVLVFARRLVGAGLKLAVEIALVAALVGALVHAGWLAL